MAWIIIARTPGPAAALGRQYLNAFLDLDCPENALVFRSRPDADRVAVEAEVRWPGRGWAVVEAHGGVCA